ncbi:hypothetical protein Halar_1383 [halophilic archaeon DL31]|nr:hypothetical protein Halar_1383 [halophilic archaeon DL31]
MSLVEMGEWLLPSEQSESEFECRRCGGRYEVQFHVCPCCGGFSVDAVDDVRRNHGPVR